MLFAGNALATHDIEQSLFGTSLGVHLADASIAEAGHEHHLRAINRIRRCGAIRKAVEQGVLTSGIMYECVKHNVDFLLAGSIRDDGPLPDVITDVLEAQRQMRAAIRDVTFCLMIATMLHSIAVGNLLPAWVKVVCVDINPSTVIKLSDRGSFQTVGLVTDVEPFLRALVQEVEASRIVQNADRNEIVQSIVSIAYSTAHCAIRHSHDYSQPHILMCPPDFYGIEYEINPWMDMSRQAEHAVAVAQWHALRQTSSMPARKISLLEPVRRPARSGVHRQRRDDLPASKRCSRVSATASGKAKSPTTAAGSPKMVSKSSTCRKTSASKAPATRSSAATRSSPATACGATPPAISKSAACSAAA